MQFIKFSLRDHEAVLAQLDVNDMLIHSDLELVLWDKDGTLIDIHEYWCTIAYLRASKLVERLGVFGEEGLNLTNACQSAMGVNVDTRKIASHGPIGVKSRSEIVKALAKFLTDYGHPISSYIVEEAFANVDDYATRILSEIVKPLRHSMDTLAQSKRCGVVNVVVTNDKTERARAALKVAKLLPYIDMVIGEDLVVNSKPHPEMAQIAMKQFNKAATKTAVIGDNVVDMMLATNAQVSVSIAVTTGTTEKWVFEKSECFVASHLGELRFS